jgi:hypothetical protein
MRVGNTNNRDNQMDKFTEHEKYTCYKFRSGNDNDIASLLKNEIWFSSFKELNDPFDGAFRIDDSKVDEATIINFLEDRYIANPSEELPPRIEAEQKVQEHKSEGTLQNLIDLIKQRINKLLHSHKNKHGVYSMSLKTEDKQKIDNPLESHKMWAHYANNFKGICIEYNLGKLMRSVDRLNPDKLRIHRKIDYVAKDKLPSINFNTLITNLITAEKIIQDEMEKIYCVKYTAWEEENEIRVLSNTTEGHKIAPNSISKIYFSNNCDENIISRISPYCKENKICLVKVSFENDKYALKFEEV